MLFYKYSIGSYRLRDVRIQFVTIPNWYWVRMLKGQTIKFVERGCLRTRLTLKGKRLDHTFIDGLALI